MVTTSSIVVSVYDTANHSLVKHRKKAPNFGAYVLDRRMGLDATRYFEQLSQKESKAFWTLARNIDMKTNSTSYSPSEFDKAFLMHASKYFKTLKDLNMIIKIQGVRKYMINPNIIRPSADCYDDVLQEWIKHGGKV